MAEEIEPEQRDREASLGVRDRPSRSARRRQDELGRHFTGTERRQLARLVARSARNESAIPFRKCSTR
jgi:hypothetical protein